MTYDAIIITTPFSPFAAGPPAGPAVLKAHLEVEGYTSITLDLNVRYIEKFRFHKMDSGSLIIGDHGKDLSSVKDARKHFIENCYLPLANTSLLPCCLVPELSLPHSFEQINAAVNQGIINNYWLNIFESELFSKFEPPQLVGFSIMGPSQVIVSLIGIRLISRYWPNTLVVLGGSHVTLKALSIMRNVQDIYGVDAILPGHSEDLLVDYIKRYSTLDVSIEKPKPIFEYPKQISLSPHKRLPPIFEVNDLGLYDKSAIDLPIQFTRGCKFGICTMCTYPSVEQLSIANVAEMAPLFLKHISQYNIRRFSVKDSLFDLKSMLELARIIERYNFDFEWAATTKIVPGFNKIKSKDLFSGGCRTIEFGVESINKNVQKMIRKETSMKVIEDTLTNVLEAGISVVINLIYGFPNETEDSALCQLEWFLGWKKQYEKRCIGSHNMLEINFGSLMAENPQRFGIELGPLGPWAFSYPWNAPKWRPAFYERLKNIENG